MAGEDEQGEAKRRHSVTAMSPPGTRLSLAEETIGGLTSVPVLEQNFEALMGDIDELPGTLAGWIKGPSGGATKMPPTRAQSLMASYLLDGIIPRAEAVTFGRLSARARMLLQNPAFFPLLYERGADGVSSRTVLKSVVARGYASAIRLLSVRGDEQRIFQPPPKLAGPAVGRWPGDGSDEEATRGNV